MAITPSETHELVNPCAPSETRDATITTDPEAKYWPASACDPASWQEAEYSHCHLQPTYEANFHTAARIRAFLRHGPYSRKDTRKEDPNQCA